MAVAVEAVSSAWSRITVNLTERDTALALASQRATQNVIQQVQDQVADEFSLYLNGVHSPEDFAAIYADLVGGAQRTLATQSRIMSEFVTGEKNWDNIVVATVTPNTPWVQSAAKKYMSFTADGNPDSLDAATEELRGLISSDLQRSVRDGISARNAVGFIKIPNPAACPWCQIVSDRVYYTRVPWHAHCRCGVIPMPAKYATPEMFIKKELADSGLGWRARDRVLTGWRERLSNPMEADAWARDRIAAHTGLKKKVNPTWIDESLDPSDEFLSVSWFSDVMEDVGYKAKQEKKTAAKKAVIKKPTAQKKVVEPEVKSIPVEEVDGLDPPTPLRTEPTKVTPPPAKNGQPISRESRRDRFDELPDSGTYRDVDGYESLVDETASDSARVVIENSQTYRRWAEKAKPMQVLAFRLYTSNYYREWNNALRSMRNGQSINSAFRMPDKRTLERILSRNNPRFNASDYEWARILDMSDTDVPLQELLDFVMDGIDKAPVATKDHYVWRGFGPSTGKALGIEDVLDSLGILNRAQGRGRTARRIPPSFKDRVISGDAFTSTTIKENLAVDFGLPVEVSAQGTEAVVVSRIARPAGSKVPYLRDLSAHASEGEVLLPPGQKFRVEGITLSAKHPDGFKSWSEWFGMPEGSLPDGFRIDPRDPGAADAGYYLPRFIVELTEI